MRHEPQHNHTDPDAPGYHTHEQTASRAPLLGLIAAMLFLIWVVSMAVR